MQAGLRLCCSQTTEDRFSRVKAHIVFVIGGVKFIIQAVMVIWYQLGRFKKNIYKGNISGKHFIDSIYT